MNKERRALLAQAMSLLALGCGRHKGTGYPGFAVVAAAGESALSLVDLTQFRLVRQVPLGAEPTAVLPGPSGHIYALTPQTGSLHVLTPNLHHAGTHRLAGRLSQAAISSNQQWLVAISGPDSHLLIADARTLRVTGSFPLSGEPVHLALGDPNWAAVTTKSGSLYLANLQSGQLWQNQGAGLNGKVCFRGDGQILLAGRTGERSLSVLSVPKLELIVELSLAMEPQNLCFTADGGQLFVSGAGMDGVAIVFPYRTIEVDQTVLAGRDPGIMAVSADPAYLFVGSASDTDVCVLNVQSRTVIGMVDVTDRPGFITLTPDNQYALVLNERSGDMAVIHVSAIRRNFDARQYKSGASLFTLLPVGERPVHALVVPRLV